LVSVGTVTAQLLYEIQGLRYHNPDVTVRFDTIQLRQDGPHRVLVSGVKGEPPPPTTKVCINYLGGYKNSMTFVLTGLDIEEKAQTAERTLFELVGGKEQFDEASVHLVRSDRADPQSNEAAFAHLRVIVKSRDEARVGRAFSNKAVEMALASYPGFFVTSPPTEASAFGVYWPAAVPSDLIQQQVVFEGERVPVAPVVPPSAGAPDEPETPAPPAPGDGPVERLPLGVICGARSGDKGGNANVGVWVHNRDAFAWLYHHLTVERFKQLLPETASLRVERYPLPNLLSINFIVHGLLGDGVAASTRSDPQAKSLGEYLRAKLADIPKSLLAR
jgi:hypothetical protein